MSGGSYEVMVDQQDQQSGRKAEYETEEIGNMRTTGICKAKLELLCIPIPSSSASHLSCTGKLQK